jgi:hypothetical protein
MDYGKEGRKEYIHLWNKYGNSPEVEKNSKKGAFSWSVKKQFAVNIEYWKKMEAKQ